MGLFTSLPLLWSESDGVAGQLGGEEPAHWAVRTLQARGSIVPLDTLAGLDDRLRAPASESALLVVAQPRPLSPDENLALDAWVRAGGHVLLFADPMLTRESRFALGDPRRPEAIAMLSPILAHWGLHLEFDEAQAPGERTVETGDLALPVNLPGRFAPAPASTCRIEAEGVIARCSTGAGSVLAVADAAVFDAAPADGSAALAALMARASH